MTDEIKMNDSDERVAYDLMVTILRHEGTQKTEQEILEMYLRCLKTVKGDPPKAAAF
jgi:predicted transposase YdaD